MNKNFGDWYRITHLGPEHNILQMRWNGITDFLKHDITSDEIKELVRMFYGLKASPEFINDFSAVFVKSDSAFDTKNKLELSVLAGATLRELFEQDDINIHNLIYFLVISTAFWNRNPSVTAIQEEIMDLFNDACVNAREELYYYEETKVTLPNLKKISEALQAETVAWNAEIAKMLNVYLNGINKTLLELSNAYSHNKRYTSICAEDSQILWWIVGKWSNDFQKPFSDFSEKEVVVYAGKELADLVTVLPGPYAAKAVLAQILRDYKTKYDDMVFSDVVNSLSTEWKESILNNIDIDSYKEITPFLYAVSLSLEVDDKAGWFPLFKKVTTIDPCEMKYKALEIAYQIYIECLSIKAIKESA